MTEPKNDFLEDTRARIPFALIAVLLLVASQSLVVVLSTRDEATVDRDPQIAMERTEAATQTALAEAVREATISAGRQPVLEAADTPYGRALTPTGETPATAGSDAVFERYVKLLIYMEARERLQQTNQTIRDDTRTNVTLDPIRNPSQAADAIDSVSLYVGNMSYGDTTSDPIGYGKIKVTIADVSIRMTRNGKVLQTRTRDVTTTVATPLFDLHDRTKEYERQLNMDFRDGTTSSSTVEGLGDYMAMYTYPFIYTRAHAQALGEPHARILAPRHLEVLANEGVYHTQRRVFGSDDRFSEQLLTRGWGRALAEDQRRGYASPDGSSSSIAPVMANVDDPGFRDGSNYIYDDIGANAQQLTDEPDWEDIVRKEDYLGTQHTVNLSGESETVYGNLTVEEEIDRAIDRVYEIQVGREFDVDKRAIVGDEDANFQSLKGRTVRVKNIERVVDSDVDSPKVDYYLIEVEFRGFFLDNANELHQVVYDIDLTINGEAGPNTMVEQRGVEYDYSSGPTTSWYDTNFQADADGNDIPKQAAEKLLPGVSDFENAETQLEAYILSQTTSSNSVTDPRDLVNIIADSSTTVQAAPADRSALRGQIAADLRGFTDTVGDVSTTDTRRQLLSGTAASSNPLSDGYGDSSIEALYNQIDDRSFVYGVVDGTQYENAPEKVRAEVRQYFISRLKSRLNHVIANHEEAMAELNADFENHTDTSVYESTTFAKHWLSGSATDTAETYYPGVGSVTRGTGAPGLPSGTYITPNTAPHYLTFDKLDISKVPAAGSLGQSVYPAAYNASQPYSSPHQGHYYREGVQLRVAAEVLAAGKAADQRSNNPNWDGGSVSDLNSSLASQRDAIIAHASAQAAQNFSGLTAQEVRKALSNELASYGPTERQILVLARSGEGVTQLAQNASETVQRPASLQYTYLDRQFHDHLASTIRFGIEDAIRGTGTNLRDGRLTGQTAQETRKIGQTLQTNLTTQTRTIHQTRAVQAQDDISNTTTVSGAATWLQSDLGASTPTTTDTDLEPGYAETRWNIAPAGTPSGLLMPDVPGWHELRANTWLLNSSGTYPRFTVTASVGTPQDPTIMKYVREDSPVSLEIAGGKHQVGRSTRISFETQLSLIAAVPGDRLGIGSKAGTTDTCDGSETLTTSNGVNSTDIEIVGNCITDAQSITGTTNATETITLNVEGNQPAENVQVTLTGKTTGSEIRSGSWDFGSGPGDDSQTKTDTFTLPSAGKYRLDYDAHVHAECELWMITDAKTQFYVNGTKVFEVNGGANNWWTHQRTNCSPFESNPSGSITFTASDGATAKARAHTSQNGLCGDCWSHDHIEYDWDVHAIETGQLSVMVDGADVGNPDISAGETTTINVGTLEPGEHTIVINATDGGSVDYEVSWGYV